MITNEEFESSVNGEQVDVTVDEGKSIHIKLKYSRENDEIQIVGGSIDLMDRFLRAAIVGAPLNHHDIEIQDTGMRLLFELQQIEKTHQH